MIVCLCRAVSDRDIRSSVRDGARTIRQLRAALPVADCCGKCGPQVRELLNANRVNEAVDATTMDCACAVA